MRIIIDCPAEEFDAGVRLARKEIGESLHRYDKPGFGWRFGDWWVCGIKGGLSLRWKPRAAPVPTEGGESHG